MSKVRNNVGSVENEVGAENGAKEFYLTFTKADADKLATCFDGLFKAYGIQVRSAANVWLGKVEEAMKACGSENEQHRSNE